MVEADGHLKLLPTFISNIYKVLSTLICCPLAYSISLTQFYPPYLARILGFWVTCGVKIMSLCHGWGWEPPQTASHIHIRHIQSVWAHWYAVHGHTVAALHSYTHPTWVRFWDSGSLVESKWCHYVMVEVDGHLKLLPACILNIYKVFEHIDVLLGGPAIKLSNFSFAPNIIVSVGSCIYVNPQMHSKFKCIRSSPNANCLASTAPMHLVNNNNPQMHTYAFGD